jgi:quinol monooxygenase YgiN
MVCLRMAVNAGSSRAQELLGTFRFLMLGTRLEPGCLGCSAWVDPDATVRYIEEWSTEADMRRRVLSDRFTSLLSVFESAHEPPRLQFYFVEQTRGLDYVAEVREAVAP